jgi:hypothetical protein
MYMIPFTPHSGVAVPFSGDDLYGPIDELWPDSGITNA